MSKIYPSSSIDVHRFANSAFVPVISPLMSMPQNNNILTTLAQKIVKVTNRALQKVVRVTGAKLYVEEQVKLTLGRTRGEGVDATPKVFIKFV